MKKLISIFVVGITLTLTSCDELVETVTHDENAKMSIIDNNIYEVEIDGHIYLVVDSPNGVGICPKVK